MEDRFDPSKEGRRVVSRFGEPNQRQVTEEKQRDQEREARVNGEDGKEKDKR